MLKTIHNFFYKRRINKSLVNESLYSFYFDVTTGIIKHDILGNDRINYLKVIGLKSPCSFDMYMSELTKHIRGKIKNSLDLNEITCKNLIESFENGHRLIEGTLFFIPTNKFLRFTFSLVKNKKNGHLFAYVFVHDVTAIEKETIAKAISMKQRLEEIDTILTSANVGIWKIFNFDDEAPRMRATGAMKILLGLDPNNEIPEEAIYNQWFANVPEESLEAVYQLLDMMKKEGKGEVTYKWYHPTNGLIYVRCGGTSEYVKGKGYILSGYHYDVTQIVQNEMHQKQLLEESVNNFKKQKILLEETLEAYKKADIDRKTDYLTGLNNRQYMFEVIEQSLATKMPPITAMFMIDLDHFKKLNDNYGHLKGDDCLKTISSALKEYGLKKSINFFRYGGEEILGISFSKEQDANVVANEIVQIVYDLNIQRDDVDTKRVTISLGYTDNNSRYEHMIAMADKALYQAKSLGRNRAIKYLEDDNLEEQTA